MLLSAHTLTLRIIKRANKEAPKIPTYARVAPNIIEKIWDNGAICWRIQNAWLITPDAL